jgi:hypothetical protein
VRAVLCFVKKKGRQIIMAPLGTSSSSPPPPLLLSMDLALISFRLDWTWTLAQPRPVVIVSDKSTKKRLGPTWTRLSTRLRRS